MQRVINFGEGESVLQVRVYKKEGHGKERLVRTFHCFPQEGIESGEGILLKSTVSLGIIRESDELYRSEIIERREVDNTHGILEAFCNLYGLGLSLEIGNFFDENNNMYGNRYLLSRVSTDISKVGISLLSVLSCYGIRCLRVGEELYIHKGYIIRFTKERDIRVKSLYNEDKGFYCKLLS